MATGACQWSEVATKTAWISGLADPLVSRDIIGDSASCVFDSGLTQASYAAAGIPIGRTTFSQATDGAPVDWPSQSLQAGDLVFIASGDGQTLGHVGMALDATHWIAAPYTGTVVQIGPVPFDLIESVRRIVAPPTGQ